MGSKKLKALIRLIDDTDERVYPQIKNAILDLGPKIIPDLERAWEQDDYGDLFRHRIEDLLHKINFNHVKAKLKEWVLEGGEDLLKGTLLVSRYRYPDFDENKVKDRLHSLRQDIWLELKEHLTAFEKVRVFNHIFYQIHSFKGNKSNKHNYYLPHNSYINDVLEKRLGNPISLAIIYQVIAQELKMPMFGVNLPNHFILAYMDEDSAGGDVRGQLGEGNILFYVNAFSEGDILGRNEINEFLEKLKIEPEPSFYEPCTNVDIIRRQLSNLENSYQKLGDDDRVRDIGKLLKLFPPIEEL